MKKGLILLCIVFVAGLVWNQTPIQSKQKKSSSSADSANVATKLELASAYIDMADKEGALELLTEALNEGSPEQRERAQALIDSLA